MNTSRKLLILLISALAIRLCLAFGYEGTGDSGAFCNAGRLFLSGKSFHFQKLLRGFLSACHVYRASGINNGF
jgi:hypothetical protein